jgi:adenylate cyclase
MPATGLRVLAAELRRRKVFRVAVVYAAVAFVIFQVADIAFPALHLPDWTLTFVVAISVLGFPVALVLAWAFEITPDGVVRTAPELERGETVREPAERASPLGSAQRVAAAGGALVLALAGGAFVLFGSRGVDAEGAVPARSIAVLPFVDLSPEGDHGWFSDGITEDIQIHLSGIGDLMVIGRTSVMRYKGGDLSARRIGEELGVATLLEGSVRRIGNRVIVVTTLINAATEEQLWAERYDQELTDIFDIQSEIARQIVATLQARLSREQDDRLARAPTASVLAYDHYLRGREENRRLTRDALERSIAHYRQAIDLDPGFAPAWSGLAESFAAMEGYHGAGEQWLDSTLVAARRAIALDPGLADGHAALALAMWNSGRVAESIPVYRRALALRPNDAGSYWGLSFAHLILGALDEAVRMSQRAVELDPAHPGYASMLGRAWLALGEMAEAERWLYRALEIQADFPWAHQELLYLYLFHGDEAQVEARLQETRALAPHGREYTMGAILLEVVRGDFVAARALFDQARGGLDLGHTGFGVLAPALVLYRTGDPEGAEAYLGRIEASSRAAIERGGDDHWHRRVLGQIAGIRGDREEAIRWLESAYDVGWRGFPFKDIQRDPFVAELHDDPRFQALRGRILDDIERMRSRVTPR